jgi:DNA-binding PadR family transcriptional regulator
MSMASIHFAVLGMVRLRPMTGYEIKQAYQKGPANFMPISFGQIYPVLARLEKEKMVRQDKTPGSRGSIRYSITSSGKEAMGNWLLSAIRNKPSFVILMTRAIGWTARKPATHICPFGN